MLKGENSVVFVVVIGTQVVRVCSDAPGVMDVVVDRMGLVCWMLEDNTGLLTRVEVVCVELIILPCPVMVVIVDVVYICPTDTDPLL